MNKTYNSSYKEIKKIGKGSFGEVLLVQNLQNEYYVAKKIPINELSEEEKHSSILEVDFLQHLKHPNIVEYKESFWETGYLYIIMEYCEKGDLNNYILECKKKNTQIPEDIILNWFVQIALALNFIHNSKILHRDLKCSNIFINKNGNIKIGDFGISKILNATVENAQTVIGTPYYMSPEVCENKPYSFKSDVWALGCIIYELCTFERPFQANNLIGLAFKIIQEDFKDISNFYSSDLRDLVKKLLIKEKTNRPAIYEILNQEFIVKFVSFYINELKNNWKETNRLSNTNKLRIKNILDEEKKKNNLNKIIKESFKNSNLRKKLDSKQEINDKIFFKNEEINIKKENTYKGNPDYIVNDENNLTGVSKDSDYVLNDDTNNITSKTFGNTIDTENLNNSYEDDSDDLEEYNSEDENSNKEIINEYENLLKNPNNYKNDNMPNEENPQKKFKIDKLKTKIINEIGEKNYLDLYSYIKNINKSNLLKTNLFNELKKKFNFFFTEDFIYNIEEIIFLEMKFNN